MENIALQVILTLIPFAILMVGFLVLKMDALKLSAIVYVIEFILCLAFFKLSFVDGLKATLWGNITLWNGFIVLWAGQVFGQCFRTTGALNVLLGSLTKIMPTKEGKAATIISVVGGFLGAFNGFATYPVTIPGLTSLGVDGVKAATGYLVYFAWSIPFVSLFVAANIASAATQLPIAQIVQVMGMFTFPLIVISVFGSFKIFGFSFKDKETLAIAILMSLCNILSVLIFTQLFPDMYILTLIFAAAFSMVGLYLFSKKYDKAARAAEEEGEHFSVGTVLKAFAPLIACCIFVIINSNWLSGVANATTIHVALFGKTTDMNWMTTPGYYVLLTAICCYIFCVKKTSSLGKDIAIATKRSLPSLATLFFGGAMVQLMLDTSQLTVLGSVMAQWGEVVYAALLSCLTFLAGICFGQGMPAARMFAVQGSSIASTIGMSAIFLVGLSTLVTMGPANPLKPSLLKYTSSLAGVKGEDGRMFTIMFKWQIFQLVVIIATAIFLITCTNVAHTFGM